jgi:protein farnesyltransferase subunit beta
LIDTKELYTFLKSMKQANGSFRMHDGGEVDIRGSYCAMNIAYLTGILTDELKGNVADFIGTCQSYEGGLGPLPGVEGHGGYTFCGLAALMILNRVDILDVEKCVDWLVKRQDGGFQGRTNKLVDGCYSFWQGCSLILLETHLAQKGQRFALFEKSFVV